MDIFYARIEKILLNASFWKVWWIKFSLNFTSTKFIALGISIVFFYLGKIPVEIFAIILAGYAGLNVYQAVKRKTGGTK